MESARGSREVKYIFDNVVIYMAGPLKAEAAFSGRLMIIEEHHGAVIEWHPIEEVISLESSNYSPEIETSEWEDVSSVVVGYKAENNNDEVKIKSPTKMAREIVFDVADLKSYKLSEITEDGNKVSISFLLKDGSNIPSFYFDESDFVSFLDTLENYVSFKKSQKNNSLYLVFDPKEEALEKSFSELDLFSDDKPHIVKRFLNDPYGAAMGSFSKVTNLLFDYVVYGNTASLPSHCTEKEVAELLSEQLPSVCIDHKEEAGFELITCIEMPPRPEIKREDPVASEEWMSYFDSEGRVINVNGIKQRIFKGGLHHSVRSEAWKYLLDYYSFHHTNKEKELLRKEKVDSYYRMKLQWKTITTDQESRFSALRDRKSLIQKDVSRTDRTHPFFEGENNLNVQMLYDILMTYCMYNFDLGYVQGMSDLLAPILVVMQNEADAFWCFAGWMKKIGSNFEIDQQGMKNQLMNLHRLIHFVDSQLCNYLESHESGNMYFAFRWLLILFKRDFKFQEIMRLWEVLWTELPCKNFHLLICIAILDTEKLTIMENKYGLTEILKHVNDMAYKINLDETLSKAEAIYHQICNCQHKSDIVCSLLGMEFPIESSLESPTSLESGATCEVPISTSTPNSSKKHSQDRNKGQDKRTVTDYDDLEQQYHFSFGLFA